MERSSRGIRDRTEAISSQGLSLSNITEIEFIQVSMGDKMSY